jgi:hypothetical protein
MSAYEMRMAIESAGEAHRLIHMWDPGNMVPTALVPQAASLTAAQGSGHPTGPCPLGHMVTAIFDLFP